ncbi:hypothetical protein B7486_20465 [cyanobacterium TDX16]|nr:hypothetical protein B7486_20465 [cyanobacterium TDX16]
MYIIEPIKFWTLLATFVALLEPSSLLVNGFDFYFELCQRAICRSLLYTNKIPTKLLTIIAVFVKQYKLIVERIAIKSTSRRTQSKIFVYFYTLLTKKLF